MEIKCYKHATNCISGDDDELAYGNEDVQNGPSAKGDNTGKPTVAKCMY